MRRDKNYLLIFLADFCEKHGKVALQDTDPSILWETLRKTYFAGFFSEKDGEDTDPHAPFASIVDFIAERYAQNPFTFLDTISYGQFKTLMEGAEWNMNEMSEEGKKKNNAWRTKNIDKDKLKARLQKLDEIFDNLDEKIQTGKVQITSTQKI